MFLFLLILLSNFVAGPQPETRTVNYEITPVPAADRTIIRVAVDFEAHVSKPVRVKLPADYFGTPDLYRYVTSFSGELGTRVEPGAKADERLVFPSNSGRISLAYELSYDPQVFRFNTYSPNVSAEHFHLAGCQWALELDGPKEKHHLRVKFTGVPDGWRMYSSLSAETDGFETDASLEDLISTAIGGGTSSGFRQFSYRGMPFIVTVRGKFAIPRDEIYAAAEKIVTLQRDYFKEYSQPFYYVVILPREENVAGVRFENIFTTFLKDDVSRGQLFLLLAHEMTHNWLSGDIIRPEEGTSSLAYSWFYEGFDEYVARKILLEAGLISREEFINLTNRDIINIADNQFRAATYADIRRAVEEKRFGQEFNKLAYYRGALMAFNWDMKIRKRDPSRSIGDLVREVYAAAMRSGGGITAGELFQIASGYGLDAKSDFEQHILEGQPIKVLDPVYDEFRLRRTQVSKFDAGFSIRESYRAKHIVGVEEGNPAYRAGLRNGLDFVLATNEGRFSNAWSPDLPLTVTVRIEGREKKIRYFPHGEPVELLLFKK